LGRLRISHCIFAVGSIAYLATANSFLNLSAFQGFFPGSIFSQASRLPGAAVQSDCLRDYNDIDVLDFEQEINNRGKKKTKKKRKKQKK
jgi:hypothetical protein